MGISLAQSACARVAMLKIQNLQPPNNMLEDMNSNVGFQTDSVMTSDFMVQGKYIQEIKFSMHYT